FAGDENGTTVHLDAGSYSVGESGPSGYTSSSTADCTGTLSVGDVKTCTVTNDDQPATLVVIKHVINGNGGQASASSFAMSVAGGAANVQPSASFPGAEARKSTGMLYAHTAYSDAEIGLTGNSR